MDTINRLQFRHHEEIFENRCKAIEYIYDKIKENGAGLASEQNSPYSYSLFAEPTILRYKNDTDDIHNCEGDETCKFKKGPHIMLVIGSETNDSIYHERNRFCVIDIDKTEEDIKNLEEDLAKAVKSLTLAVFDTSTLDLHVEKTEDGTFLSGDVKTAETHIFEDIVKDNNLMIVPFDDEAGPEGLFIYVDLTYDEPSETFTFVVSQADGTLKKTSVKLPNNYLVSGIYKRQDESLHLRMRNGDEVVIDCEELIDEWDVEGDASKTPIVLTRERVDYDNTEEHHHVEPWQDILRADVRIADDRPANILDKTVDGRYLYVDGIASNIVYYWNNERSNVKEQLDKLNKIKISQDNDNIIWEKTDGYFASTNLDYISSENKLILTTSSVNGTPIRHEVQLNTVDVIESITYDPTTEELVIKYKNDKGETKVVRVPISAMIDEWDVLNTAHSVKLVKQRKTSGKDILTADVNISSLADNILEETSEQGLHTLYVKGTADNIAYNNSTVKDALDGLIAEDEAINQKIDNEIARATAAEEVLDGKIDNEITDRTSDVERIDMTIGSGFSTDAHETVTYRFEQLTEKVDDEIERSTTKDEEIEANLNEEIERSTSADTVHDRRLDTIDTTIGSGFTTDVHETVTYKFEQLKSDVNTVSGNLIAEIERSTNKDTEHDGRLDAIDAEIGDGFGPRFTIEDAVNELSADTRASLKHVISGDSSVNVLERNGAEGREAVIKVNLSEKVEDNKPNIIKLNTDGLYAGVDLLYDFNPEIGTNNLIFKTTNSTKTIELKTQSIIDKIYYDPNREAIIIEYTVDGHRMPDVVVPVGDLINEWRVEDGHPHAVQLEKVRISSGATEQDILKASVIITDDHDDNILVMDDGSLYVPANTDVTAALSGAIDTERERAISAETSLNTKIESEITRATNAETALSGAIDTVQTNLQNEINRATAEEARIETKLDNEITRSTNKDSELEASLTAEVQRATSAETSLNTALNNERTRAISAETALQTSIDNETTRAVTEEARLAHLIEDEKDARESADTILQNNINNETARATAEESRIEAKLDNEVTRSTNKDDELEASLATEAQRATSAEASLTTALSNERTRAISAETALQTSINNEVTRATAEEIRLEHLIEDEEGARTASDNILQNNIDSEVTRATSAETRIETKLDNEITRSTNKDEELYQLIVNEKARATEADTVLDAKINTASADSFARDSQLEAKISAETITRESEDTIIKTNLQNEINNRIAEDQRLSNAITAETEARQQADAELEQMITDATLRFSPSIDEFESNGTIEFNDYETNNNIVEANVIIQGNEDNIIKVGNGIYATVHMSYDIATNKLRLTTSAGSEEFQLAGATVIDNLYYNNESGEIVITYHDGSGNVQTMKFPASELFNEWIVQNPSEKSAVELTKTSATEQGQPDELKARVLITDDRDGDGKPDQGSDNIIEIRNNGLYVCGSGITEAQDIAECVQNEIKVVETAVIGHIIGQECGSGYTYEPHNTAKYINSAISFNNADYILDQSIKNVEEKVDIVSAKTDCNTKELKSFEKTVLGSAISEECGEGFVYNPNLQATYINSATSFYNADQLLDQNLHEVKVYVDEVSAKTDCVDGKAVKIYQLLYGENQIIQDCGEGTEYIPDSLSCVISGATSFMEADRLMAHQICEILEMWTSGETCTSISNWVDEGSNKKMMVDVKVSRGNTGTMTDDEIVIENFDGDYIDPTRTEFTDTNALRVVCMQEGPGGVKPAVDTPQNGIYLSNVWDCGMYYGASDAAAKAAAEAVGYNTNYSTDESASAGSANYMNNVRQNDI